MRLLFSFISLISLSLNNIEAFDAINIVPGGQNVGIEIRPGGLLITGSYDVKSDNYYYNPKEDDIQKGDIIYKVNENVVKTIQDFTNTFKTSNQNNELKLHLKRKGKFINRKLKIIKVNNQYKTGLFIKERVLGLGTISFYDEANKIYGALGHEMTSLESGELLEIDEGSFYGSNVTSINPSINSKPGEKIADIDFNDYLGNVLMNTNIGIYGKYNVLPKGSKTMELGEINEVHKGKAELWTVIEGNKVERYEVKIKEALKQTEASPKGILFEITDQRLLNKSHGVVAGMSGSPLIQDNKVIGAVTHVITSNVRYGYGVYMRFMFDMGKQVYELFYG